MAPYRDIALTDGRFVRVYDSAGGSELTLLWHHGSPQTGALLDPLLSACAARHIRLVSYARPSYRGSTPAPGRDVASAGRDVGEVLDAIGIGEIVTMGASGGGPHALACAAVLAERVRGVVTLAGIAPYTVGSGWFDGMAAPGGLRAALDGRESRVAYAETDEFDPAVFTAADYAALEERWAILGADAGLAGEDGPDGLIDDDLAFAGAWGFDLASVTAPTLLVQGGQDRIVPPHHAEKQLGLLPHGQLWLRPADGHISVLESVPVALDWLLAGTP